MQKPTSKKATNVTKAANCFFIIIIFWWWCSVQSVIISGNCSVKYKLQCLLKVCLHKCLILFVLVSVLFSFVFRQFAKLCIF